MELITNEILSGSNINILYDNQILIIFKDRRSLKLFPDKTINRILGKIIDIKCKKSMIAEYINKNCYDKDYIYIVSGRYTYLAGAI